MGFGCSILTRPHKFSKSALMADCSGTAPFFHLAGRELECSLSAWPFVAQPTPHDHTGLLAGDAADALCDGTQRSFAGAWTTSDSRWRPTKSAYVAALHNQTSWSLLPPGSIGRFLRPALPGISPRSALAAHHSNPLHVWRLL
jgi:hypothetical protein